MAWRAARSLVTIRSQVNAKFPRRRTASDGLIGDASHQNRSSDHNPWYGPGIVTAADITHDPAVGLDMDVLTDQLQASRDSRIKYVIFNRWIMDSRSGRNPWKWVRYKGANPHTVHMHLSVVASPLCDNTALWNLPILGGGVTPPRPPGSGAPPFPLPPGYYYGPLEGPKESVSGRHGSNTAAVRAGLRMWQQRMRDRGWTITPDGIYGPRTRAVALAFQRDKRLVADGLIGPATWFAAWAAPVT
jgi:hypothetical protein